MVAIQELLDGVEVKSKKSSGPVSEVLGLWRYVLRVLFFMPTKLRKREILIVPGG